MKRLLITLLLFSSPVLAEKERIYYVHKRPPSSYSGTIGPDGFFHYFTNSAVSASADGCDIRSNGCWIKTNVKAEIINKDIIKVNRYGTERYFCSEEHIQAVNKANPKPTYLRYSSLDHGYGICTKDGWQGISIDDL